MRGGFKPPAYGFLDSLFCELLSRKSNNPSGDAQRIAAELKADPLLMQAAQDEYVGAYAIALATAHQSQGQPSPKRVWMAAAPSQKMLIDAFVIALRRALNREFTRANFPPTVATATTRRAEINFAHAVNTGLLLAADHDRVWGSSGRESLESVLSQALKLPRRSVQTLVPRHRARQPGQGLHSLAATRKGHAWLTAVQRTLLFARLKPLHPALLTEDALGARKRSLAIVKSKLKARTKEIEGAQTALLRKGRPVPTKREDVEHLLPPQLWARVGHLLPKARSHAKPRKDILLAVLVVLHYGAPWHGLPQTLGLGSGAMVLRTLRKWQASPKWQALKLVLAHYFVMHPDLGPLEFERLGLQTKPPMTRQRKDANR